MAPSPDGKHIYVTSGGDHAVTVFSRDRATGRLTFVETQRDGVGDVDGLRGARSVAVSPNGRCVYVTGQAEHTVVLFRRDRTMGKLTFVETLRDGVAGVDGIQGASYVTVSPDKRGKHVYVAGNWVQAIAVFNVLHP